LQDGQTCKSGHAWSRVKPMEIICKVCGATMDGDQCKCQAFSEIPLPKQKTPAAISTDGAIRAGDPPHDPASSNPIDSSNPPTEKSWLIIGWCAFAGVAAGIPGGAIFGYFDFDKEPAPIISRGWIMLFSAACCGAPIGLFFGVMVGILLGIAKTMRRQEDKSTHS
jgi:hypothetical protein